MKHLASGPVVPVGEINLQDTIDEASHGLLPPLSGISDESKGIVNGMFVPYDSVVHGGPLRLEMFGFLCRQSVDGYGERQRAIVTLSRGNLRQRLAATFLGRDAIITSMEYIEP